MSFGISSALLEDAYQRGYADGFRDGEAVGTARASAPMDQAKVSPNLPFRDKPELDVDFYNDQGDMLGTGVAVLKANVNATGIIVTADVSYQASCPSRVAWITVWVGDVQRRGIARRAMELNGNDVLNMRFTLPVDLRSGDFWWGDGDNNPEPPASPPREKERASGR